ncbi:MAG: hypothetical protein R2860_05595 [Desulfobacterales bacterium]
MSRRCFSVTRACDMKSDPVYGTMRISAPADTPIRCIQADTVRRNYDDLTPKVFATYELDDVAPRLRDTSVSMGLSEVWTPQATCGLYRDRGWKWIPPKDMGWI